jgi:outer membrane protein assembly factor BamB
MTDRNEIKDMALLNILRDFFASHRLIFGVLLIAALLLAACGGGPGDSWAGVSTNPDTDTIYVAYNKRVVALDVTSGERLWEYKDGDVQFFAVPVVDDGTIFVGDYEGRLHAISTDGVQQWVYTPERRMIIGPVSPDPKDRVIGSVAVDSDKVFFGLGSRNVVAVSRTTAEKVWTFETDHGVWGKPLYFPATNDAPPTVYVVSLDHYLYAIHADTGDQLWRIDLGGAAPGGIVYDEARNWVYAGTFVSEVVAVDLATHEIVDRYKTKDWVWGRPVLLDDTLFVGDLSGNLYAVSVTDQGFDTKWEREVADGAIRSTPVLTDGVVIVSSKDKHVYAVNKDDGSLLWSKKTKGEALTELVFIPSTNEGEAGLIAVGTSSGSQLVVTYNIGTGEEAWSYKD